MSTVTRTICEIRRLAAHPLATWHDRYRPELHYMRGPGPACRRKAAGMAMG
jgi:hypothetical protein